MNSIALMLAIATGTGWAAPTVAVFSDPQFPYFAAGTGLIPPDVAAHLRAIGLDAELLNAEELADPEVFNAERFCGLVNLYGNTFPARAGENIRRFHQNGGGLISVGVPYCHPCEQEGARGWSPIAAESDEFGRSAEAARTGQFGLKLVKDSTPGWSGAVSGRVPAAAGEEYVVGGWARTGGEIGSGDNDTLFVRFFGAGGEFLGQWGPLLPEAAREWTSIRADVQAPEGATQMDVCLALFASPGTVWLDDVNLTGAGEELLADGGFEAGGGAWMDLGHVQRWLTHEGVGSGGFVTLTAEHGGLTYHRGSDPLELSGIDWAGWADAVGDMDSAMQALDPASLPEGDTVIPIVTIEDGGVEWPIIAAIQHGCEEFSGAVDIWAGVTLFSQIGFYDAIDQREVISRAALYIAEQSERIDTEPLHATADELYASQKMPGGIAPVAEPKPFDGLFPKSPKSAGRLVRADVRLARRDVQMLLTSLQGLVNRKRPRIYLDITQFPGEPSPDERWLAWLQERGDVQAVRTVDDPLTLLGEHRSEYRGLVVTDPAVPGTVNVATMIAGVENLLVASPELAAELDIPVIEDLRGRWTTNAEALDWAGEELWPKLNHHAFAVVHPDLPHLRDYLIAHRIYTFWVTGDIDGQPPAGSPVAEQIAVERVLAKAPVNVGCLGAPYNGVGIGFSEAPGVSMLSRYGKFLAWSNTNANLSVHSGTTPRQPLRHRPADVPELDPSKVYITMMVSDGDAPVNWYQFFPGIYWDDPAKGTFPLTWSMGPSVYDLMPDIMDYYYARANGGDGFVAACSGAGYCYPDAYGRQYADQDTVYEGYLDLTNRAMERLDLRGVWTHTATGQKLRDLAERVPMAEYLLPDYSRKPTTTAANANYAIGDVAVFHALTSFNVNLGADATMKLMIDDIRGYTPTERPGFMNVFVQCYPWTPSKLKQVLDALGPEYVPVRADHLGELYRRATQ